uniref:Uncharacterized protein n=1 Tax=Oryza punctata TaxID=4537 RepID=A0A0E0LLC9_ORYPU
MRNNSGERWVQRQIDRYGSVSKLSLFGKPTVLLAGAAANKFFFFSDALAMQQPRSVPRILGRRSILELVGADHRRVRGALLEFLRPEILKMYVGKIDGEARCHVADCWAGSATSKYAKSRCQSSEMRNYHTCSEDLSTTKID